MENQIEIYQGRDGQTQIEVKFEQETDWLSLDQVANLFNRSKQNISLPINNCFKDGELDQSATGKKSFTFQQEGKRSITQNKINVRFPPSEDSSAYV